MGGDIIKILMLGNTQSGKTTYMSSAYSFLQKPVYGFSVKSKDKHVHKWFLRLYDNIRSENIYPSPTDKKSSYEFNLYYHGTPILPFEWKDFKGGIIDTSGNDINDLVDDIKKSDAIMMFFEGDALLKNERSRTRLRRVCNLINHNLSDIDDLFFITIVITKYDLLLNEHEFNQVISPLNAFIKAAEENENIIVHVVPVACTKHEFLHVDLPLLTILYGGILKNYINKGSEIKKLLKQAEEYSTKAGWLDNMLSKIFGEVTYQELAQKTIDNAQNEYEIFKKIEGAAEQLGKFIDEYEHFKAKPLYEYDIFML